MRFCKAALLVGIVLCLTSCRNFILFPTKSYGYYNGQVLDQYGTPVAGAKVSVEISYTSVVIFPEYEHVTVRTKKFTTVGDGVFKFELVSSDEQVGVGITISKPGYSTIHYGCTQDDFDNDRVKRLMLPKITNERIPTTKSITSGGGNGRITIRTPWLHKPLYFDLEKKSFVESGGDFEISVERADFGEANKKNRPFEVAIKAVDGTLLPCDRSEYGWSFTHCVPSWGTNQPILLHSPNSRNYPNAWTFFTFHTRNGKDVGRATMVIDVIGERKYNDPSKPGDTQALVGLEIEAFFNTEGSPILGDQPLRL